MAICRKCGREGRSQFSSDYVPGLYCSNGAACEKRVARKQRGWTQMGCYFCTSAQVTYEPEWRETRGEALTDWKAHVLAEHADMQWTQDYFEWLQPEPSAS